MNLKVYKRFIFNYNFKSYIVYWGLNLVIVSKLVVTLFYSEFIIIIVVVVPI